MTTVDLVGLEQVRPSARCHACGKLDVQAVCSGCARLMCKAHDSLAGRMPRERFLELFRFGPRQDVDAPQKPSPAGGAPTRAADRPTGVPPNGRASNVADGPGNGGTGGEPDTGPSGTDGAGGNGSANTTAATRTDGGRVSPTALTRTPPHGPGTPGRTRLSAVSRRRRLPRSHPPAGSRQQHYCTDCRPVVRPFDDEMIAATVTTGVGATLMTALPVPGAVLAAVGVLRLGIRTAIGLRRPGPATARAVAKPTLNPQVRKITVRERVRGSVRFTASGDFESTIDRVVGSAELEGTWSRRHREVLDKCRARASSEPLAVAAGYLVLHGPARAKFRPAPGARVDHGPVLVLEPLIADQPVLSDPSGHGDTRWKPTFEYDIAPPAQGWRLPVWITPNVAADTDRHVLELHVQWSTGGPEPTDRGVPLKSIELLELDVPAHWGEVEYVTQHGGSASYSQPTFSDERGIGVRTLRWRKIPAGEPRDRGYLRLAVRFSRRIDLIDTVNGRLEARFTGAVSGSAGVGLYRTDGARAPIDGMWKPLTVVEIGVDLDIAGLRYQAHRSVPDPSRAEDVERRETQFFQGVVPDSRTVALLTNTLADEGYYIIRVLENPAQSSPRPGALNRLWDIAGRHYEGLYPIDFHLVLSGEEAVRGRGVRGETTVSLNVHGSYANDAMEQRVVEEWTRLWKRIRSALGAATRGPDGGLRAAEQPLAPAGAELARLRSLMVSVIADMTRARADGRMDPDLADTLTTRLTDEFDLGDPDA
ncbi:MAG: hypothetical protein AB7J32_25485 [Pseudonocardia sp.]